MDELMKRMETELPEDVADAAEPAEEIAPAEEAGLADALRSELEAKFRQLLEEQLRLSRMSEDERAAYEEGRRLSELEAREREVTRRELRADAMEALAGRGLPKALADAVNYDSAEAMRASLDAVERAFRDAVQAAVEERLRGESPAAGASAQGDMDQLDDESYYRMVGGR